MSAFSDLIRGGFGRIFFHLPSADVAERLSGTCVKQPEIVVELCLCSDRRTRITCGVFLPNSDRRGDARDFIDIRLVHPLKELPSICRE